MNRFFAVAALCCTIAGPGLANSIAGQASVIDGDTIEIHGERIRLVSIDAPESRQPFFDHQSRSLAMLQSRSQRRPRYRGVAGVVRRLPIE